MRRLILVLLISVTFSLPVTEISNTLAFVVTNKEKRMNNRYIPQNAQEIKKDGLDAVAYTYESSGVFCAIAYSGRRHKSDFHFRYSNEQKRTQAIAEFFKRIEARVRYKQERQEHQQELRAQLLTKIEVGSIFATCWGYEQTNVEWYQITHVKGCTVRLRRIAAEVTTTGYMSGSTKPVRDAFIGEELKRIVRGTGIRIDDVVTAFLSDGSSRHCSWYA